MDLFTTRRRPWGSTQETVNKRTYFCFSKWKRDHQQPEVSPITYRPRSNDLEPNHLGTWSSVQLGTGLRPSYSTSCWGLGKAVENGPSVWAPATYMGNSAQAPSSSVASLSPWVCGEWSSFCLGGMIQPILFLPQTKPSKKKFFLLKKVCAWILLTS